MCTFTVIVTEGPGYLHFIVAGESGESKDVERQAKVLFDRLSAGKETFVRKKLETESNNDFESNIQSYISRFRISTKEDTPCLTSSEPKQ